MQSLLERWSNVPTADYMDSLSRGDYAQVEGARLAPLSTYGDSRGLKVRFQEDGIATDYDYALVGEDALLIAGHGRIETANVHCQSVDVHDWIHIMFKVHGETYDEMENGEIVRSPSGSVILSRYPAGSRILRYNHGGGRWKVACLLMPARALPRFLGAAPGEDMAWLTDRSHTAPRNELLAFRPAMAAAIGDILDCGFTGSTRLAYMRAKSLELMALTLKEYEAGRTNGAGVAPLLRLADRERVEAARQFMAGNLGAMVTLDELARRAGFSRSKLKTCFKQATGKTVQSYWRDLRLEAARRMLEGDGLPVTQVALNVGYSEISPFTRAFYERYGILPKDCRRQD